MERVGSHRAFTHALAELGVNTVPIILRASANGKDALVYYNTVGLRIE